VSELQKVSGQEARDDFKNVARDDIEKNARHGIVASMTALATRLNIHLTRY